MRSLILFVIGLVFGTGIGLLAGGSLEMAGHDHEGHSDAAHDHSTVSAWSGDAPILTALASREGKSAVNLSFTVSDFTFAPDQVNGPVTDGTGHAHIYVNGTKVARAYSGDMYLENVPADATIRITLNANDHSAWAKGDQPIVAEIIVP